jgi:hypothetical protein|mmetsp:Transcript_3302/g.7205  ORF Transcript_3302/g.7205 Transcript_3302/m.7205 type:complete len:99 (-) Transcript_3302:268-564(-)
MDEHWREIYNLADLIADRHLRTGKKSTFLEPPVERLRPASPLFDVHWKEKVIARTPEINTEVAATVSSPAYPPFEPLPSDPAGIIFPPAGPPIARPAA